MQPRVPDFFVPAIYAEQAAVQANSAPGAGTWPLANRAQYVPCIFPYPCTLTSITFVASNGTGNYDLGLYDGYSKNKIASTGSTAMTAAGPKTLTFSPPVRVDAGKLYYGALSLSSTSGGFWRFQTDVPACIVAGCAQETSALPLPATMTPATIATAIFPIFIFGVR